MSKKIRPLFLLLILFTSGISFAQNFNWITPGRVYLKFYVVNEGLYRINRTDFVNSGINPAVIDPRTIKLYYKGVQVPVYFNGEGDGSFNDGDYFDFYGNRNAGGLTNTYNQFNIVSYVTDEYYNIYSDTSAYWVDWGGANGIRYANSTFTTSVLYPSDFYLSSAHFEKDKIYYQGENLGGEDTRYLNTEKFKGEGWYWKQLSANDFMNDTISLPGLSLSPHNASIHVFAYPLNDVEGLINEHTLEVKINGTLIGTLFSKDFHRVDTTINFSSSLLSAATVNDINIKYVPAPGFAGLMYFDNFEITYPHSFKITNKSLSANLNSTDTTSKLFKIAGYNPSNTVNIFDVRNNFRITNFSVAGDTIKFTGKSNARFAIVNDSIRNKPVKIKQRQVPDLVSNTNGADYLLIYNSLFQAQAEQLRAYRQTHDNFRSVKTEIEDIYDIFNYGIEDPIAVKYFVKHVYDNWQLPKLKYICLFGRGSLDPKKNSANSIYEKNLVPVYGNPTSDGYYSNMNIGTFFYYDQIAIGRLPAYYPAEAQVMVNKIISYENEPVGSWSKTYSFITGGSTFEEQQAYQTRSNFEANLYAKNPPVSGEVHKVYRTDSSGSNTFNYADSIKNEFNRGTMFVNFRGHSGSHDWEVGMSDPNVLNNAVKQPVVLSLTCFTGENSKADYRGFGEKFMYLEGKGAIGFVATTGWGFVASGNDFGTYIIQTMQHDTTRRLGDLTRIAGKLLGTTDSVTFPSIHTVGCYKLMGDPALTLKLPKYPEFAITNNDYKLLSPTIVLNQPTTLKITPKNYGLYADTCRIRFQIKKSNITYSVKDTLYRGFKYQDTILYNIKIDSPGVYTMTVILDANNRYPQEDESNNSITFTLPYDPYAYLPITPVNNSIVYQSTITFKGLNPVIDYSQNSVRIVLQLDTGKLFNSPVLQTYVSNSLSGVDSKFNSVLPVLNNNTIYYWRTNSLINNDSSGWSKTNNFIFNNGLTKKQVEDRYVGANTIVNIEKSNPNQFNESDFNNTNYNSNGVTLNEFNSTLFVRSLGSNGEEASYFSVGNQNVYIDAGLNKGLNVLKVKKLDGRILDFKNFTMNFPTSSDSLVNFLNTFDSTQYLMLLNAAYVENGTMLSNGAKSLLRQFGSIYCDSIGILSYFHTWSLIGFKGAAHSQVSEMFDPCCTTVPFCNACDHWTQSVSSMNVRFKKTSGTLSNIIGPAKEWNEFSWKEIIPANSNIVFDVIGIQSTGAQTLIRSNLTSNSFVELASIDAHIYPMLNLLAKFSIDTVSGNGAPVLNSINANYSPASELVIDRNSLTINSVQKDNNNTGFSFDYHNSGYNFIYGTIVRLYNRTISDSNLILADTITSLLKIDSTLHYSNSFAPPLFRDSTRILINIKPKSSDNEFYTFNNTVDFPLNTGAAASHYHIEVLSDGRQINSGDIVSKNPEIKINLSDTKVVNESDTTNINLRLNGSYIPYYINGGLNPVLKTLNNSGDKTSGKNLLLQFNPSLQNGNNKLSVIYKVGDGQSDTISYDVFVSDEFAVNDLYNFPNPMRSQTDFIFNVSGSLSQYLFKIKIYTITGRLIKEIDYNARLGNNSIPWDGKDSDGDFVANGTYLYKLIVTDDVKLDQKVQKLVILK